MVYKFYDKKSSGSGVNIEPNYQLTNGLHRKIITKFKRRKVYSLFRDNIGGVGLANIQSLSCNVYSVLYIVHSLFVW